MPTPRVLIVDDAHFMRIMLSDLFSRNGLEVAGVAANGDDGLRLYLQTRPDVVTMDIMMPGSDGLQALRKILEADPTALVVVISALDHDSMVREAMALGAVEYLAKPFSPARVVEVVRRIGQAGGARQQQEDAP